MENTHSTELSPEEGSNRTTELLYEHEMLRQYMVHIENLGWQILAGTLLVEGTLIGLALNENTRESIKAVIFATGAIIAFMTLSQAVNRGYNFYRTASYLRNFTERETQYVKWETRLMKFRKYQAAQSNSFDTVSRFSGYQIWTYIFLFYSCMLASAYYLNNLLRVTAPAEKWIGWTIIQGWIGQVIVDEWREGIILGIVCAVVVITVAWRAVNFRMKYLRPYGKLFDDLWEKVAEEESQNQVEKISREIASDRRRNVRIISQGVNADNDYTTTV